MMKCDICEKTIDNFVYNRSYPLLITKYQEIRGVTPSGDVLLRVCKDCDRNSPHYHNAESQKIIK